MRHNCHMEDSSNRGYVWPALLVFALTSASHVAAALEPDGDAKAPIQHKQSPYKAIQTQRPIPSGQHLQTRRPAIQTYQLHGHAYRGRVAWHKGRWHHANRNGHLGWWWDVGGIWYFYPEQSAEPPAYISDVQVDEAQPTAVSQPPPQQEPEPETPHKTFYYRPGDLNGVPYDTLEECTAARIKAGNGVCVVK